MTQITRTIRKRIRNLIPEDILNNKRVIELMENLPKNYNFEVFKTIHFIVKNNAKRVALQMPEGLLLFATTISDILYGMPRITSEYCKTVILSDVTYGACCVDDYTASALACDALIHYGHSCLVPITCMKLPTMYIFVDIKIDIQHLKDTIAHNFQNTSLTLCSTVQFVNSINMLSLPLARTMPLSSGEILGCTAPKVDSDALLYVGDGRFHLESIMIANPSLDAFTYNPYTRKLTKEVYNHDEMKSMRRSAIDTAKTATTFAVILGTLGRQGSIKVLDYTIDKLKQAGKQVHILLMSEIFPKKLGLFDEIDCFVQIACPRLSIDWCFLFNFRGYAFSKPLLTPYECAILLGNTPAFTDTYPMDYYERNSSGPWTPNH